MRASRLGMSLLLLVAASAVLAGCTETPASNSSSSEAPLPVTRPYRAAVAYVNCMRRNGVPFPSPDRVGDFHLTPAGERQLRGVPRSQRQAADDTCFHHLKGTVSTRPLSSNAKARAIGVLRALAHCMHGYGYEMGPPVVRDLRRGRAFFGFSHVTAVPGGRARDNRRARLICEKRVDLAGALDRIIADDRGVPNLGRL
jgi:hypothetical protein